MDIRIDVLQFLQLQLSSIPINTPQRIKIITREIVEYCKKHESPNLIVCLDINLPNNQYSFTATEDNILYCASHLPRYKTGSDIINFGTIILMPNVTKCCERKFRIDPRFSKVRLYTESGIKNALSYHGRCNACKTSYFYSYYEESNAIRKFRNTDELQYFVASAVIGFSIAYLRRVTLMVSIGAVSFEKIILIYNMEYINDDASEKLSCDVLENNWLMYRLVDTVKRVEWIRKSNFHVDIERICQDVYPFLKNMIDNKWAAHKCLEVGCSSRMIVIDGNEKLYRYCCSQPIEKVKGCNGKINFSKRCINNPVRGNQNSIGSKKCELHVDGQEKENESLIERLDFKPHTRSLTRQLQIEISTGKGCKDEKNCNKYVERTAGMLYIFRPCGIRLSHYEMYTAESLSTVFTSLIDLFEETENLNGIVYDRACELSPYIKRLALEGNQQAMRFCDIRYIVDIFHAEKHTKSKCVIGSEDCKFHPDLNEFADIRKMNMEICEQSFHILNCYKHITRNMTYGKRLCFLKIIDEDYNSMIVKKLKK